MLEQYIRPKIQTRFIDKAIEKFDLLANSNPNFCTLLATLSGFFAMFLIAYGLNVAAILFLLISGFLDVLDGSIARYQGNSTQIGTVFDILSDRFVEGAVVLGLFLVAPQARGFACLLMMWSILCCVTSFLVVGLFSENDSNKSFYYSPGIIERFEAFLFFIAMILCPSLFTLLAVCFSTLVFLTTFIRIFEFYQGLKKAS